MTIPSRWKRRVALLLLAIFMTTAPLAAAPPLTPKEHLRAPEQTFLTYPEWFLVHSPGEYAAFIQTQSPSRFPFFGHIGQFWQGYAAVARASSDGYPFNFGYHVMVMVIGVSTTVEYGLKGGYELLVGRLTELTRRHGPTEEDRLAARVAQDYVDFIRVYPWYQYDFTKRLGEVWTGTSLWGPDMIRKWERKYFLTTEYAGKAIYGWVIKKLTQASYDAESPVTGVALDRAPGGDLPEVHSLQTLPDGTVLATVPRYAAFTDSAKKLTKQGVGFVEIAGNRTVILVSVLVPRSWRPPTSPPYRILFTQPILTEPERQRVVMTLPVAALGGVIAEFDGPGGKSIEHIYDY